MRAAGRSAASHYFREIAERGVGLVLKEMALLAMQLQDFAVMETEEEVITFSMESSKTESAEAASARRPGTSRAGNATKIGKAEVKGHGGNTIQAPDRQKN